MLKDEIKAIVKYIDSRISSVEKVNIRRGEISDILVDENIVEIDLYGSSGIKAKYDINANYQIGDVVAVLSVGGDTNIPENNLVVGQYEGIPNPISTDSVILGGDMEGDISGWTIGENVTDITVDSDNAYMGNTCLKVSIPSEFSEAYIYKDSEQFACKPNELYKPEAYFRTLSDNGAYVKVRTQWFNPSGGTSIEVAKESEYYYITSGSGYIPVGYVETSPEDASAVRMSLLFKCIDRDADVYVDNVGVYGFYVPPSGEGVIEAGHGIYFSSGSTVINADVDDSTIVIDGNDKIAGNYTGGAGIDVVNNVISSVGDAGFIWEEVTDLTKDMVVDYAYVANNAALVTLTLPTVAAFGDCIRVVGKGAGGWKIAQNAGQTIHFLSADTTAGVAGFLEFTNQYDCIDLACISTDTDWVVNTSVGNITIN